MTQTPDDEIVNLRKWRETLEQRLDEQEVRFERLESQLALVIRRIMEEDRLGGDKG
jgi:hypothetical protein